MNVFRVLLNSVSVPWIQCMETVLNELTNWEILTNSLTVETVELVEKTQPDIVAWKIEDDLNCLDLYELKKRCPMVLPVIIVNDPNQLKMRQFVEYGACGCLPARLRPRQIVAAMELIAQAGICCIPRFYTEQQQQMDFKQVIGLNKLTIREQEIFSLLCQNYSNQEIAEMLSVCESTVKTHLSNIYRKMGKTKRGEVLASVYHLNSAQGIN